MKALGTLLVIIGLAAIAYTGTLDALAHYHYDNDVYSNWTLSDRSSTLEAKSQYIDQFVTALSTSGFAGQYDALFLKTPTNSCENNLATVQTLQQRLTEIQGMDENSLQYQQAISQITAQEQGEADDMLTTLQDCWFKTHYYYLWSPISAFAVIGSLILIFIGGFIIAN